MAWLRIGEEPVWLGQTRGGVEGDEVGEAAQVFEAMVRSLGFLLSDLIWARLTPAKALE